MIFFTKMQGIGNDFIIINNIKEKIIYSYSKISKYLCDRNFGIGADGVLFVEESKVADYKMRIFNSDGTEAEMCGNGIRCFAKYLYEERFIENKKEIKIETLAGIKNAELITEGKKVISVKVNMGNPCFDFKKIPVFFNNKDDSGNIKINDNINIYPISMGNPHAIFFVNSIYDINIEKEGKLIENYKYFPNKTNVEFVKIIDNNEINIRVWERGVGETLACGTGACAATVISYMYKGTNNKMLVGLKGGNLKVEYNVEDNIVFLEGEAEKIFSGKIEI